MELPIGIPSVKFLGKVALAMAIVFFVINMLPASWGIGRYFKAA